MTQIVSLVSLSFSRSLPLAPTLALQTPNVKLTPSLSDQLDQLDQYYSGKGTLIAGSQANEFAADNQMWPVSKEAYRETHEWGFQKRWLRWRVNKPSTPLSCQRHTNGNTIILHPNLRSSVAAARSPTLG
jgi:hypothetical protein